MYYKFFFSYKNWAANSKKKKRQKICDVNMINYLKTLNYDFHNGKKMNITIIYYQKLETKTLLLKTKKKHLKCFSKSFSILRKLLKYLRKLYNCILLFKEWQNK